MTHLSPPTTLPPAGKRPRKEKTPMQVVQEIVELTEVITNLNQLTFLRNHLNERIEKETQRPVPIPTSQGGE